MLLRIWQENQGILRSIAGRILPDRTVIDDVMQEALLRLLRYRPSDAYRSGDFPLMRRVVWTTAIDHYRKQRTGPAPPSSQDDDETPLDLLLDEERLRLRAAALRDVRRAMDELPEALRVAVSACFLREKKTICRVSRDLDLPVSTLRSRAIKGIEILRRRLLAGQEETHLQRLLEASRVSSDRPT